ncbi:MAG: hypothetical protein ACJ0US_13390 [Arenicellales bacterium]
MLAYTDDQWQRFWSLVDKAELVTDPRFDSLSSRSKQHRRSLQFGRRGTQYS